MSETTKPHRVLHLVVEGFPPERLGEITANVLEGFLSR